MIFKSSGTGAFNQMRVKEIRIIVVHSILARGRTTLCSPHSFMAGPAIGSPRIQAWNLGEDFEKRKAERIMNGVVGMMGTKAPNTPRPKLTHAQTKKIAFNESFSRSP